MLKNAEDEQKKIERDRMTKSEKSKLQKLFEGKKVTSKTSALAYFKFMYARKRRAGKRQEN